MSTEIQTQNPDAQPNPFEGMINEPSAETRAKVEAANALGHAATTESVGDPNEDKTAAEARVTQALADRVAAKQIEKDLSLETTDPKPKTDFVPTDPFVTAPKKPQLEPARMSRQSVDRQSLNVR